MNSPSFYKENKQQWVSIKTASQWATKYLKRPITASNISYLLQYGRIKKYTSYRNKVLIKITELKNYYDSLNTEKKWRENLGTDINTHLSFIEYKESARTKHVHKLHPYKGKFIPQLVEYFLNSKKNYFKKNDIILDPFCGSGTTLVQASEMNINAIGVDISKFNSIISNVKVGCHNIQKIKQHISNIISKLENFQETQNYLKFESQLLLELRKFNSQHFPSPEYKRNIHNKTLNERIYSKDKEKKFLVIYNKLIKKYQIKTQQNPNGSFINQWLILPIRKEADFINQQIKNIKDKEIQKTLTVIMSRTIRSCRATTHADLGTLKQPAFTPYYCKKHKKICKPLFSLQGWWKRYTTDTLNRLEEFQTLRTQTFQYCLTGDSRGINIYNEMQKINPKFAKLLKKEKFKGIFSSPPYVGLIDYHEQHAYSYEMFHLTRRDQLEIGPLFKGQGKKAQNSYVQGIVYVLKNCKKYLQKNYDIFLVANDKFNLYPRIAQLSNMQIINHFKRPVLNRLEKDRSNVYSETIFHLKEKFYLKDSL